MTERAVRFGAASLVGVVTEAQSGYPSAARWGVVFLNSGLLHRVGAGRLHVRLARDLSALGVTSVRFDFSGIGDSDSRRDGLTFEKSAVLEVRDAMDYLATTRSITDFIIVGLCSGADMGFEAALIDTRIRGLVQLDAYSYRTWRYYVHRYGPRLLNGRSWQNLFTGKTYVGPAIRRLTGAEQNGLGGENLAISPYARDFPPKQKVADGLRTLVDRGVRLFNIFSGGQEPHYNHRSQYEDSFRGIDFRGQLRVEYLPEADHTFTAAAHQQFVLREVREWIRALVQPQRPDETRTPSAALSA
jgi:hypothetical protein